MSRHPIGDHAMTSSERQRRYLAKLASSKPAEITSAPTAVKAAQDRLIAQLRDQPRWIVPWLVEKLGRDATVAVHAEFGRALGKIDTPGC